MSILSKETLSRALCYYDHWCSEAHLLQGKYYIFSATSFPFPIQRAVIIDKEGFSKMINPKEFNTRSQDLVEAYHDAGQFYYAKKDTWINEDSIFDNAKPIILPRWLVQDIDTLEDFKRAELMHKIILN